MPQDGDDGALAIRGLTAEQLALIEERLAQLVSSSADSAAK